jgi:Spy/CpxP family protein refolding chaperone
MGMMGGCGTGSGMMGMMDSHEGDMADLDAFSMLNLTPDQKVKLNKIQLDLRKQHWALMGKNIDNKALLNELYAADRPDPKKIGQVYASIFDIRRQMIESRIDAMNRMKDVLTKEQLDKLKQLQQEGPMHHGMMMDR